MADTRIFPTKIPHIDSYKSTKNYYNNKQVIPNEKKPIDAPPLFFPSRHEALPHEICHRALDDYVDVGLLTRYELDNMPTQNPSLFAAILKDHVAAALGIKVTTGEPVLSDENVISMKQLRTLTASELATVTDVCEDSDQVTTYVELITGNDFSMENIQVENKNCSEQVSAATYLPKSQWIRV